MFGFKAQVWSCWLAVGSLVTLPCAAEYTVWDYAPDFKNDAIPPYPSLKNPDGSDISIDSIRGVRLFGWKGCGGGDREKVIARAYNDFYKLSNQQAVYNAINWKGDAAIDFFGPGEGDHKIPDDTRKEIQRKYQLEGVSSWSDVAELVMLIKVAVQRYSQLHSRYTVTLGHGSRPGSHGDNSGSR